MFRFLLKNKLNLKLAEKMLPVIYEHPKMDFDSVLSSINFKKVSKESIFSHIPFLKEKFDEIKYADNKKNETNWIMGELSEIATGNIDLKKLSEKIENTN
jgi:glutamyl-tRNA(Gln) amidotransferase subunit E